MVRASETYGYPVVKAMQIVRVLGIRKDEDWRKQIRLVFQYMPHEMKYSCGTTQQL